jgi:hypothetical protein
MHNDDHVQSFRGDHSERALRIDLGRERVLHAFELSALGLTDESQSLRPSQRFNGQDMSANVFFHEIHVGGDKTA